MAVVHNFSSDEINRIFEYACKNLLTGDTNEEEEKWINLAREFGCDWREIRDAFRLLKIEDNYSFRFSQLDNILTQNLQENSKVQFTELENIPFFIEYKQINKNSNLNTKNSKQILSVENSPSVLNKRKRDENFEGTLTDIYIKQAIQELENTKALHNKKIELLELEEMRKTELHELKKKICNAQYLNLLSRNQMNSFYGEESFCKMKRFKSVNF